MTVFKSSFELPSDLLVFVAVRALHQHLSSVQRSVKAWVDESFKNMATGKSGPREEGNQE